MRKSFLTGAAALALLVGVASLMFSAAASARPATAPTKVTIGMHDPGCHWFVNGSMDHRTYAKTKTVKGSVALLNLDEAALIVSGPKGKVQVAVGATKKFTAKGAYTITMVKQAADDNHLKLTIK